MSTKQIPIIDLFAGPGGLGEGFTSVVDKNNSRYFRIALSIEKDEFAHKTLMLSGKSGDSDHPFPLEADHLNPEQTDQANPVQIDHPLSCI